MNGLALPADAVNLKLVVENLKAELFGCGILDGLNLGVEKLD